MSKNGGTGTGAPQEVTHATLKGGTGAAARAAAGAADGGAALRISACIYIQGVPSALSILPYKDIQQQQINASIFFILKHICYFEMKSITSQTWREMNRLCSQSLTAVARRLHPILIQCQFLHCFTLRSWTLLLSRSYSQRERA